MSKPIGSRRHLTRVALGGLVASAFLGWLLAAPFVLAAPAGPPVATDRLPVLILDGGLGDGRYYISHWLGAEQEVASSGPVRLVTASAPTWWGGTGAPDTYVLTASDASGAVAAAPLGPTEIAWALDRLAERHAEGKAMIVAQGACSLSARLYLESLASPQESTRADVVGLVMLGPPNAGCALQSAYPDLSVWTPYAAGGGMRAEDLMPRSAALASLDGGRLPSAVKTLVIQGVPVSLAGAETDGVVERQESRLATGVSASTVDYVPLKASASESFGLAKSWLPKTKKGGATVDRVDDDSVAKLSLARGYSTSPDVRATVRTFYTTWFSGTIPTTHISTQLVLDVSGSMRQPFGDGTKLDAARAAAGDFADSLGARLLSPQAVPEDIGLIVFNTKAKTFVRPTSDATAVRASLKGLQASDMTDVGKALAAGVDSLASAPQASDKVLVFLSDGLNSVGLEQSGILAGPVAAARKQGVRIEVIALGTVGQSDGAFLKQVASATGGSFHQARDRFELRRDFLRARYSSLGTMTVDVDVALPAAKPVDLGRLADGTRMLEIGVLPDNKSATWQLARDGVSVPASETKVATSPDGVVSIIVASPLPGQYTLMMANANGSKKAHVFAVVQADAFRVTGTGGPEDNTAMLLIAAVAVLGVGGIAVTVFLSMQSKRNREDGGQPSSEVLASEQSPSGEEGA